MNGFINWFTKKRILIVFSITTILLVILYSNISYTLCKTNFYLEICREIRDVSNFFTVLFFITPIILFFLAITVKMREDTFFLWRKFTLTYLLIYLFVIIITPWYFGDEFLHIGKGAIALILSCIYFVVSLILIIYKSFKKE